MEESGDDGLCVDTHDGRDGSAFILVVEVKDALSGGTLSKA